MTATPWLNPVLQIQSPFKVWNQLERYENLQQNYETKEFHLVAHAPAN